MNIKKIILILFLLSVIVFSYFVVSKKKNDSFITKKKERLEKVIIKPSTMRLKGVVTDVDNMCWVDGVCSVEIDGKWWVGVTAGGKRPPGSEPLVRGEVVGIEFDEERSAIGKKVEVYGEKVGENFLTIYGSKEYYIRVIDN